MASRYLSIVRLLQHFGIDINLEPIVSRWRKQVLLEFAVAENGIITVDEYSYNKNDVLSELDKEDFESRWSYHKTIWQRKLLLEMLEDDSIDLDNINNELIDLLNDQDFKDFISPYFSFSFNNISRSLLYPPRLGTLSLLLNYQSYIHDRDYEYAFSSLHRFLLEQVKLFNNASQETYHLHKDKFTHWTQGSWAEFLNKLPSVYQLEREEIVTSLINLTVALQRNFPKETKAISRQLLYIKDISQEYINLIVENHKIYIGKEKSYWWVFWVVFLLAKILTCN